MDSILTSIKKLLGLESAYTVFDNDIIMLINSALMTLTQIGIGPSAGVTISSAADLWSKIIGTRTDLEGVKTYVYLMVRLSFDPPQTGYLVDAIKTQLTELTWRLNVIAEGGATA